MLILVIKIMEKFFFYKICLFDTGSGIFLKLCRRFSFQVFIRTNFYIKTEHATFNLIPFSKQYKIKFMIILFDEALYVVSK